MIRENIEMVITTLEIKRLKRKSPLLTYENQTLQSSHLNFCFQINWLRCLKSRISLFLPEDWIDTERGLTTWGTKGTSTTEWLTTNSIRNSRLNERCIVQSRLIVIKRRLTRCINERNAITKIDSVNNKVICANSIPIIQLLFKSTLNPLSPNWTYTSS